MNVHAGKILPPFCFPCNLNLLKNVDSSLTLVLLNRIYPAFANSVDPDQMASEEAYWSGSALFAIKFVISTIQIK